MSLRRRLVATMVVVVAVVILAVDVITWTSLRSFLYGRVDSQLTTAAHQVAALQFHDAVRGVPVTALGIRQRVSPDVYVVVLGRDGVPVVTKPSGSSLQADPRPTLPDPLPVRPLSGTIDADQHSVVYRPAASAGRPAPVASSGVPSTGCWRCRCPGAPWWSPPAWTR